jgi:RNA polymerase sigma-70 factor, ECF subfamily
VGRARRRGKFVLLGATVNLQAAPALVHSVLTLARDYAALFQEVGPDLWRAIYAYSGGRRDVADEAVAEAFARAIQGGSRIRRPASWLYRVAFRVAADELRRSATQEELTEEGYDTPLDLAEVTAALRRLSPSQRAAVYLHYRADLPVREVARLMGTSSGAVRVHLHRGRNHLRQMLGSEETDDA